ncbi:MAG: cell envelope biogenesis protein OmpA [Candidatus Kapaibacterium sp.]|nr:MAG: cell envelope biogenesis protein OmpA [Candidatus Kapabacteria bacterium]
MKRWILVLAALPIAVMAQIQQRTLRPTVEVFPFEYNSAADDFCPAVTHNGATLYFTSDRSGEQRIYVCRSRGGQWLSPDRIRTLGDAKQIGCPTLTPDGQTMIFAAYQHEAGSSGRTDLYMSKRGEGYWSKGTNLGATLNSSAWDSQGSLSSDGRTLYFASDRPGGKGGTDLYRARWLGDRWSEPEPLGELNTEYDEITPSIAPDDKTLYFASNRPGGNGGYDIYVARLQGNRFGQPQNLGQPINTDANDISYIALPNSTTAYFASDRAGGSGGYDIWRAVPNPEMPEPVVTMRGIVRNSATQIPIGADIIITDLKTRQKVATFRSDDETGEYYVTLTAGRTYAVTAYHPDYLFYSEQIEVPTGERGRDLEKNIDLAPIANENATRLLVFFDFDKADLKEESLPELDLAATFLREHPDVKVRIEGHTDDVGTDDYNLQLSRRRAEAVKKYLVSKGIDEKRITTVGYGKSQPKVKDTTPEARAQNRRVEMKIVAN